jgi:hypothetical protein
MSETRKYYAEQLRGVPSRSMVASLKRCWSPARPRASWKLLRLSGLSFVTTKWAILCHDLPQHGNRPDIGLAGPVFYLLLLRTFPIAADTLACFDLSSFWDGVTLPCRFPLKVSPNKASLVLGSRAHSFVDENRVQHSHFDFASDFATFWSFGGSRWPLHHHQTTENRAS